MLTPKQRAVISAGIRKGVGVAPRCNLFQARSPADLKVGFKRGEDERVGGADHSAASKVADRSPKPRPIRKAPA